MQQIFLCFTKLSKVFKIISFLWQCVHDIVAIRPPAQVDFDTYCLLVELDSIWALGNLATFDMHGSMGAKEKSITL